MGNGFEFSTIELCQVRNKGGSAFSKDPGSDFSKDPGTFIKYTRMSMDGTEDTGGTGFGTLLSLVLRCKNDRC